MCRNWHGTVKGNSGPGGFKLVKCRTRPLYQSKIKRETKKTKSTLTKFPDSWMLWSIPEKVWAGFPLTDWKESIKKWHKIRGDKAWFRYNRPERLHFLKNQLSCGFVSIGEGVVNENLNYWLENVSLFLGFWSSFCRHPLIINWLGNVTDCGIIPSSERIEEWWILCSMWSEKWSYVVGGNASI